jgi:hypothetical protein
MRTIVGRTLVVAAVVAVAIFAQSKTHLKPSSGTTVARCCDNPPPPCPDPTNPMCPPPGSGN